jgi:hypothetical protein
MLRRARMAMAGAGVALVIVLWSAPAGAQQLVDAGKEGDGSGGLAFVLFAAMVFIVAGAMFFMDRIRRRPSDGDSTPTS